MRTSAQQYGVRVIDVAEVEVFYTNHMKPFIDEIRHTPTPPWAAKRKLFYENGPKWLYHLIKVKRSKRTDKAWPEEIVSLQEGQFKEFTDALNALRQAWVDGEQAGVMQLTAAKRSAKIKPFETADRTGVGMNDWLIRWRWLWGLVMQSYPIEHLGEYVVGAVDGQPNYYPNCDVAANASMWDVAAQRLHQLNVLFMQTFLPE